MENYNIATLTDQISQYEFYGVWGNFFKLGNIIFEAIEDPDDGYRSHLDSVVMCVDGISHSVPDENYGRTEKIVDVKDTVSKFPKKPIALVTVFADGTDVIIRDAKTNHTWLSIGTDDADDYYPCFFFTYAPMPSEMAYSVEDQQRSPEIISAERFI